MLSKGSVEKLPPKRNDLCKAFHKTIVHRNILGLQEKSSAEFSVLIHRSVVYLKIAFVLADFRKKGVKLDLFAAGNYVDTKQ